MNFINSIFKIVDKYKIVILTLAVALIATCGMFGMSFLDFYNSSLKEYEEKNYNFNVYNIFTKKDSNLYYKLKENKYVNDVFYYNEYKGLVRLNKESFYLIGTIPSNINISKGRNFDIYSSNEIICPENFSDGMDDVLNNKTIDIENYLNQEVIFYDLKNNELKMQLVGLFNSKEGYYEPNECYTSHNTIKKINENVNENIDDGDYVNIYVQVNNKTNIDKLKEEFPNINFDAIFIANDDAKIIICSITLLIMIVNLFLTYKLLIMILKSIENSNVKREIFLKYLTVEAKPVILGVTLGSIFSIFIGNYLIFKIIPNAYLFYSNHIHIKLRYIVLNILIISLFVIVIDLYLFFYERTKKDEKK